MRTEVCGGDYFCRNVRIGLLRKIDHPVFCPLIGDRFRLVHIGTALESPVLMGKKVYSKGVRLLVSNAQVMVEISILIQYGYVIPDVARKVQEAVMTAVTNTSGMEVSQVNVQVAGISFQKKPKEKH